MNFSCWVTVTSGRGQVQWRVLAPTWKPSPSDVSDEEWAFAAPYLTRCRASARQQKYELREVFNALRWMVKTGAQWHYCRTTSRHGKPSINSPSVGSLASVVEALVHDLRVHLGNAHTPDPSAVIMDARTLQSTPASGHREGYDGHERKRGNKLHLVVDTLGHLLTLTVTPAARRWRSWPSRCKR